MFLAHNTSSPRRSQILACVLIISITPLIFAPGEVLGQSMKMDAMPGMGDAKQGAVKTGTGTGTVTAVNVAGRKVTLDHGPMPSIPWPAMKMEFPVAPSVDLSKVKTGDKVEFTLSGSDSSFTVQSISPGK